MITSTALPISLFSSLTSNMEAKCLNCMNLHSEYVFSLYFTLYIFV